MIIADFNIRRAIFRPFKDYPKLIVNSDAEFSLPFAGQ
jgi:hypothetical protein